LLYAGLKAGVTAQQLRAAVAEGSVEQCLHAIEPQAGDCIFIPAGTVHALGAGLLVAEIQQASNTTFRLFDWNRVDANGTPRALHVEQALEVIDFTAGPRPVQTPQAAEQAGRWRLVSCDKFVLDRLTYCGEAVPCAGDGRFHLLTVPAGAASLEWEKESQGADRQLCAQELSCGQSVLIPAAMPSLRVTLAAGSVLLDMYLPN
jgi:mannose-6-phosphate isomerase